MFLQSGMNDFLSKPLEFNEIERVLQKWLPSDKWSHESQDGFEQGNFEQGSFQQERSPGSDFR
jgi:response regulator of citrate/malate metabolism